MSARRQPPIHPVERFHSDDAKRSDVPVIAAAAKVGPAEDFPIGVAAGATTRTPSQRADKPMAPGESRGGNETCFRRDLGCNGLQTAPRPTPTK